MTVKENNEETTQVGRSRSIIKKDEIVVGSALFRRGMQCMLGDKRWEWNRQAVTEDQREDLWTL